MSKLLGIAMSLGAIGLVTAFYAGMVMMALSWRDHTVTGLFLLADVSAYVGTVAAILKAALDY